MKVIIIGGGASGMMAALRASTLPNAQVTVLERQSRVGRKLLATGNGRCNLTNRNLTSTNYHGTTPSFVQPALSAFSVDDTLAFFQDLGLLTVTEPSGRVYPRSDQAGSVVDVLRFALESAGVTVVCGCEIESVRKKARGYQVTAVDSKGWFADRLILAAGGCAGRKLGGTELGYRLLEQLGHTCSPLYPSLTQIKTEPTWVRALKGVRADGRLSLKAGGHTAAFTEGELQFTEFGVSGPVAFALSRAVSESDGVKTLLIDFCRDYAPDALLSLLQARRERFAQVSAEELFTGLLQTRLGKTIVRRAGIDARKDLCDVTDDELRDAIALTKCYALDVTGLMGMDSAQVTAGGILTSQFRADTLESRIAPGVFACGEVLDIDGDCGGYNLQWAWSSGHLAGALGTQE